MSSQLTEVSPRHLARYKPIEQIPDDFFCCEDIVNYYEKHKHDTLVVYPTTAHDLPATCNCGRYRTTVNVMLMRPDSDGANVVETRLIDIDEKPMED